MNNQEKYQLWLNQYKAIQSSGLSCYAGKPSEE